MIKGVSSRKRIEYEFHKWKKELIIADKTIYIVVVIFLGMFRPDALMMWTYFMLFPYLFLTARKKAIFHLAVASLVALVWTFITNSQYGYNQKEFFLFGLNSFPLFAWAVGLFAGYMIYSHWEHKLRSPGFMKKMILFVIIYWFLLILVETVAYHVFDIYNLVTAAYSGLPFCDCIHAPRWMQFFYFALGPIYFGICELIGLENPHHIRKKV